jgi:uncharacterized lipoprotein YmbA
MKASPAIAIALLFVLASCGSSPKTHYFTLAVVPGDTQQQRAISSPVTVAAIHIPPSLDRREMVRRTGQTTVDVSDRDRWTAPLDEMVRMVLSQDLADRMPKDKVVLPHVPAPQNTAQIVLSLAQFGPAEGRVALAGSWALLRPDGKPLLLRNVTLMSGMIAPDAAHETAAMSQLLGQLASEIAATLPQTPRS